MIPQLVSKPTFARGVHEVEMSVPGYRAFNIVYSTGDISFHWFPSERVNSVLIRQLTEGLDVLDPIHLRIV